MTITNNLIEKQNKTNSNYLYESINQFINNYQIINKTDVK